ncbi:hypothetical protein Hamer_G018135 [Homarus americanus]|uniref:Cc8K15.2-like protein n=1 Tax=Homarus americanus TaxID=6706 RepID=A0A8J5N5Y4_HOMAM|nr:hypothetical protein Hamer_G018135 [Homarus americanus]
MASTSGSGTKPKTRKDNEVWLIGPTAHALTGLKLPSTGEVMIRLAIRKEEERARFSKALAQKTKEDEKQGMNPPFSSSSESEEQVNSSASECSPPKKSKPGKPRAKNIMSPVLAKALDRTKISDRDAVHLIAAAAQTLGHNVEDIAVNRKTIRQSRMKLRVQSFKSAKEQFILNLDPTIPLVVHWDGKLLPETAGGKETYDRLPIIVSYEENEQLLNVSKLPNGTGEAMANAVVEVVKDWKLKDYIVAMSFDTTSSNTGRHTGACKLIEIKLEKNLLWLPCRHHVHEVVIGGVFDRVMGPSTGPDILVFKRFQAFWPNIVQSDYSTAATDQEMDLVVTENREVQAPANDLLFLKKISDYTKVDKEVSEEACRKFINHLWYLNEEVVGFAFFDMNVGDETKQRMVDSLKKAQNGNRMKAVVKPQDVNDIHLEDFVSSATSQFFDMLNLPTDFLQLSPSLWQTNAGYCKAQKKLKTMKVVNDVAERGVALIQDYIHVITKDEEQRQFLLQVVSDHRKNFPNSLKRTVIEALKKNDLCC